MVGIDKKEEETAADQDDCYHCAPIADPFDSPLRLRTAVELGYKNAKWIGTIEVTTHFARLSAANTVKTVE